MLSSVSAQKNKNQLNGRVRTSWSQLRPEPFFGTVLPHCLHPVHLPTDHAGILVHTQHFLPRVAALDVAFEVSPPLHRRNGPSDVLGRVVAPLPPLAFFLAVLRCSDGVTKTRLNVSIVEPGFQLGLVDGRIQFQVNLQVRHPGLRR